MPPAENTPDFDKMSPEEIMSWMESLAKRQGVTEGFTTSADMTIPDIDPTTVVIDEPGYVPSEGKMKGKKIETFIPPRTAAPAPAAPKAEPTPVQVALPEAPKAAPPPAPVQPAASAPSPLVEKQAEPAPSGLSWLESLVADQGGDFPSLDLSSIAADLAPASAAPTPAPAVSNPVDWLESLAQDQGVENVLPVTAAADSGDPMSWLESLAKRQGAATEELTTAANLDIPLPENLGSDGPGYTDYTFETPDSALKQPELSLPSTPSSPPKPAVESSSVQDPSAWLDALASSQGVSEAKPVAERKMSDDEIQHALSKGQQVPHDQMEAWMNRQLEIGAQRPEPEELTAFDPDAPAVKAEIPDWLIEQVGSAPPEEAAKPTTPPPAASVSPALIDAILEPPPVSDMPDWLRDEAPSHGELENIFAPGPGEAPSIPAAVTQSAIEIDPNDPWVEALEMEYVQGKGGVAAPPPPAAPAAAAASALPDAALQPETELPAGELEAVPDWLHSMVTEEEVETAAVPADMPDWLTQDIGAPVSAPAAQPISSDDMPDWLKSADIEASEVPSWLTETLGTSEEVATITPPPAPMVVTAPMPAAVVPAARPLSPAPIAARALQIDVPATLNAARSEANGNNIEGSLQNYDLLIRANAELDAVVGDLLKMAEKIKTSPAVYRILGDGLMRQGKLQAALDIYRKALNQL